ncbi:MAG TPA: hypothetical protein RMH99_02125 [Sandaracinaceae bacterium LLY-WYZ-13_1]|nr:hypothetical protein [Sandaracinaceae bacterium LLY-WYZ-13_1]
MSTNRAAIQDVESLREALRLFARDRHTMLLHVRLDPRLEALLLGELLVLVEADAPLWFLARRDDEPLDVLRALRSRRYRELREAVRPQRLTVVLPLPRTRVYSHRADLDRLLSAPAADGWRFVIVEPRRATPFRASTGLGAWAVNLDVALDDAALARADRPSLDGSLRRGVTLIEHGAFARAAREYAHCAAHARADGRSDLAREATGLADDCVRRALRPLRRRARAASGIRAKSSHPPPTAASGTGG